MELAKFLSLCAMLFGVIAVLFLSRALFSTPEQILRATYHYSSIAWPSVDIISDKASQKADTVVSIILVFLVLAFQLCALFVKDDISFTSSCKKGVLIALILVGIVTFIVQNIDTGTKNSFGFEIKKLAARDYIKSCFEVRSRPLYRDVESIAKQYFHFCKEAEEANPQFVKRFAKFLEYQIPENANFSKFR